MQEQIIFGDKTIPVNLPDNVISARPGLSTTLEPIAELEKGGVRRTGISLVSAGGIHRKSPRKKWKRRVGCVCQVSYAGMPD